MGRIARPLSSFKRIIIIRGVMCWYIKCYFVPVVDLLDCPVPGRFASRRDFLDPLVSNKLLTFLNLAQRSLSFASRTFSSSSAALPCGEVIDDASKLIFGAGVAGLVASSVPRAPLKGLGDVNPSSCSCPTLFDLPLYTFRKSDSFFTV
jgi:hypothetical protein